MIRVTNGKKILILLTIMILLTVIVWAFFWGYVIRKPIKGIISTESGSIMRELTDASIILQNDDLTTVDLVQIACSFTTIQKSMNQMDMLFQSIYPRAYLRFDGKSHAIIELFSDIAKYIPIIPLDTIITNDGKTVRSLINSIIDISYDVFNMQESFLKNYRAICIDIYSILEEILQTDYGLHVILRGGISIFEYFEALNPYISAGVEQ